MTLQQLRDLLAVVSHGGYRAAARAMDVSQAGLTKSLSKLEEQYSISLLQRTVKGIVLTPEGEEFVAQARAVLQEVDRAEEWLHGLGKSVAVQVRLGVSLDPSLSLVPAVLRDFRATFPQATIHITQRSSSELLNAIRDNRLDLAVTRLPDMMEEGDLRVEFLYDTAAAIVARKGHPLRHARSVQDLAESEWIVVGDPAKPGQQDESIRELFIQQKLGRPRFAAVSDSLFGVISTLLESDCVARMPAALLSHPLASEALTEIRVHEQLEFAYRVGIVSKAGRRLGRETSQLVAMLKSFSRMTRGSARSR
ncbi:MAG: LysR substrate-binding domain-containing protein [Burkholderiaceae bacterium]|nr:LysR substrate-binding domain-containing protein [Burkholderiaceae bacterium]